MRTVKCLFGLLLLVWWPATADADCNQHSLRLAVIPKKNMVELMQEYQPLLQRLQQVVGMPVDIVAASSYESVVDAIVSGGVDIAWLGPASYVLAHGRAPGIEPFASLTISEGYFTPAGHHYQALLLVKGDGAQHLDGLVGKRLALSDPASTSGSVVPKAEFSAQVGMPVTRYFGSTVYTGSHDKSLEALLQGKVDAAFVSSVQTDAYLNSGKIQRDTLRVLWRSAPIYYDPFVFRAGLCAAVKEQVRTAMLTEPQALAAFLAAERASGVVPVSHANYQALQQMMQPAP